VCLVWWADRCVAIVVLKGVFVVWGLFILWYFGFAVVLFFDFGGWVLALFV